MKKAQLFTLGLCFSLGIFISVPSYSNNETRDSFEDPDLVEKLIEGEILLDKQIDELDIEKIRARYYVKDTSTTEYFRQVANYGDYPKWIPEITSVTKTAGGLSNHQIEYSALVKVGFKFFYIQTEIRGRQTFEPGASAIDEAKIKNEVTNYGTTLSLAEQQTRLVPYKGGLLVEDIAHVVIANQSFSARKAKRKLMAYFFSYAEAMKMALEARG